MHANKTVLSWAVKSDQRQCLFTAPPSPGAVARALRVKIGDTTIAVVSYRPRARDRLEASRELSDPIGSFCKSY